MVSTSGRPESAITENVSARVSEHGMQNASVNLWTQIETMRSQGMAAVHETTVPGLCVVELFDSRCGNGNGGGGGTDGAVPKANLQELYKSGDKFTFAGKEIQDALDALRKGDLKEGKQELGDAIKLLTDGLGDVRNGVGGDFDLSELAESNPLRRVGSGRQAIRGGRSDLESALAKLGSGDPQDINDVLKDVESGMVKVLGGNANIQKAVGLIERGEEDHRPNPDVPPSCGRDDQPQPQPPSENPHPPIENPQPPIEQPEPKEFPALRHEHELHTGTRHLGKARGNLQEAIGEIMGGEFHHAMKELKGTLHQLQSATKDLRFAFGGEVPGQQQFDDTESQVFKAIKSLRDGNFEQSLADIRKALVSLRSGRSDVHDAATVNVDD